MDATASIDTPLEELLARVERGETVTLIRNGRPVARIGPVPAAAPTHDVAKAQAAMDEIFAMAAANPHPPLTWDEIKQMRDEGRR